MMRSSVTSSTMRRLEGAFRRQANVSLSSTSAAASPSVATRQQPSRREMSSLRPSKNSSEETEGETNYNSNQQRQPFANSILEPGEWDANRRDPYHRPKPPRNKLISAEDFANRPPVGFDNEFSTYDDSMIALSWLDTKTCKQIYSTYVDMMVRHQTDHPGRTSHEYVCRVLAQRFQITTWRAAGVVQLQHAEEQMRRNNPELLCEEQAQWAEETILKNISDAYKSERSQPPNRGHGGQHQPFVEDPVGIHGLGEPDETSTSWVPTDDIYDLEAKLQKANVRDDELARVMIDEHVYDEDVDEATLPVRTDGVAKRLIKAQKKQQQQQQQTTEDSSKTGSIAYPETNGQGIKRPRWKYVAKVVNTRAMRKKGRKIASYANNNITNTLVEHDGKLRVATVEEAKKVAWKPTRTRGNSYIYEGAQRAWLDRTLHGKTEVWGKAPKTSAAAATAAAVPKAAAADKAEEETAAPALEETDAVEGEGSAPDETAPEESSEGDANDKPEDDAKKE